MAEDMDLQRFVAAQDTGGVLASAVEELRAGVKRSHWMWFIFPQVGGLGHSGMARRYAISGLAEARAYLAHPVLGDRLKLCAGILTQLTTTNAVDIFGIVDSQKLRSSMTLFARADPTANIFQEVLDQYFGGAPDPETDRRLGRDTRES